MNAATEALKQFLAACYLNERGTNKAVTEFWLKELNREIFDNGQFPTVELLGPADCRNPDPDRIRVAV